MKTIRQLGFVLLMSCLGELSGQQPMITLRTEYSSTSTGPLASVICTVSFPAGSSQHTIIWKFKGQYLAVNGTVQTPFHDRYQVQCMAVRTSSFLKISNTLQSDRGTYFCLIQYMYYNAQFSTEKGIFLQISQYLPPPGYPSCHTPSLTLYDGDKATFSCTPGDAIPYVNLRLVLVRQLGSGHERFLGYASRTATKVEKTATIHLNDKNSQFECIMTSATFTSFMRKCVLGPLRVFQREAVQSTTPSGVMSPSTATAPRKVTTPRRTPHSSVSAPNNVYTPSSIIATTPGSVTMATAPSSVTSSTSSVITARKSNSTLEGSQIPIFTPVNIGIAAAGFLIILIIIIMCFIIIRKHKSVNRSDHSMDNVNSSETRTTNATISSGNQVPASYEDISMPVYSVADTTELSTSAGGPNCTQNSDFPIYSKVNKDHGMVDNAIYVSSGPM